MRQMHILSRLFDICFWKNEKKKKLREGSKNIGKIHHQVRQLFSLRQKMHVNKT